MDGITLNHTKRDIVGSWFGSCLCSRKKNKLEGKMMEHNSRRELDTPLMVRYFDIRNTSDKTASLKTLMKKIENHPNDCALHLDGCKALNSVTNIDDITVLLLHREMVDYISDTLKNFPTKPHLIQQVTLILLRVVETSGDSCEYFARKGGMSVMLNMINTPSTEDSLIVQFFRILAILTKNKHAASSFVTNGYHKDLIWFLQTRSKCDEGGTVYLCTILSNCLKEAELRDVLIKDGIVHTLVKTLLKNITIKRIIESTIQGLVYLSLDDGGCKEMVAAGSIYAITKVMTSLAASKNISEMGCQTLAHLYEFGGSDIKLQIFKSGGVDATLNAMEAFPNNEIIQEENVSMFSGAGFPREVNRRALTATLKTIKNHSDNVYICKKCCKAVAKILEVEENLYSLFAENKGTRFIVRAMDTFPEEPEIQYSGCVIFNIISGREEFCKILAQSGAVKAVISALLTLDEHKDVQVPAVHVLEKIVKTQVNKIQVVNSGGILALLNTLKKYSDGAHLYKACLRTLVSLADLSDAAWKMAQNACADIIFELLKRRSGDVEVVMYASKILCSLLITEVLETNDRTLILLYLRESYENNTEIEELAVTCCRGFENVLSHGCVELFDQMNGLTFIVEITTKFPHSQSLYCATCNIITRICESPKQKDQIFLLTKSFPLLLHVMRNFQSNADLQILCTGAFICLLQKLGHQVAGVSQLRDIIGAVLENLKTHVTDVRVQAICLLALKFASQFRTVLEKYQNQLVTVVLTAMEKYPEILDVQTNALELLMEIINKGQSMFVLKRQHGIQPLIENAMRRYRHDNKFIEISKNVASVLSINVGGH